MSAPKSNGPIIDPALCRCCRAIKKCRVLTAEYSWMGKKEVYADMVMDCYGILLSHVDDNEKDSGVCATCVVRLREATAFRHQVLQCEELFLQAKLAPAEEETDVNYENKLKKMELENLELKTEPKDYNSDHNSMDLDDRDDGLPNYSDDEDNKPLKGESKPADAPKDDVKSEDSEDYNGSSSDSDEPIKKKAKRKAKKANGAKKKPAKVAKKQKADTEPPLTEEIIIKDEIKIEFSEEGSIDDTEYIEIPVELDFNQDTVKKKRIWVRDRSNNVSEFEELEAKGDDEYFRFLNMSKSSFEELHSLVEDTIGKIDTNYRKSISSRERLAICLRHFRTGHSHSLLSSRYNVGVTTVSQIVKQVSRALWTVLQPLYMPAPREHTWQQAETGFRETLNFPNCVGSIGGKHIIAKLGHKCQESEYPKLSDSAKERRVTVALLAVTDPTSKIVALDIGNYGKQGDANILENSKFYGKYMDKKNFLPPKPLPGDPEPCPHVLIGDGSFIVRHNLLRQFSKNLKCDSAKKNFNKWMARACTADKAFQMLMDSWAVLHRPMEIQVESAVAILKAVCCLHNFILAKHGKMHPLDTDTTKIRKRWGKKSLTALKPFNSSIHRSTNTAIAVRDRFLDYFNHLEPFEAHGFGDGESSFQPDDTGESSYQLNDTGESSYRPNDTGESSYQLNDTGESRYQPDTVESRYQPDTGESICQPDTGESSCQPDTGETSYQPDTGKASSQPDTGESNYQPDTGESSYQPDTGGSFQPNDTQINQAELVDVSVEDDPFEAPSRQRETVDSVKSFDEPI